MKSPSGRQASDTSKVVIRPLANDIDPVASNVSPLASTVAVTAKRDSAPTRSPVPTGKLPSPGVAEQSDVSLRLTNSGKPFTSVIARRPWKTISRFDSVNTSPNVMLPTWSEPPTIRPSSTDRSPEIEESGPGRLTVAANAHVVAAVLS